MIRKLKMRSFDFDFRHVTRSAVFVSDGTTRLGTLCCWFTFHSMTVRTLGVVVRWVLTEWFMRIVTTYAADVFVVGIALTMKNAIRLKTNVVHPHAL